MGAVTHNGKRRPALRRLLLPAAIGALLIGLAVAYRPDQQIVAEPKPLAMQSEGQAHAARKRKEEIDHRFKHGAALLNARQYEAAANELHRVLELAPQMPEAHVNMGFAMIGVQRFAAARDFFNVAIDLHKNQHNAYFGLAVALEGLGDLRGALGAMLSYVHLSKADNSYLPRANAAIWEWETALKARSQSAAARQSPAIPENGNNVIAYPIREKRIN